MSEHVPRRIVVMGVSGCGKSTVARVLAERLSLPFFEADALHPPRNVAMMASGTPLADDDRQGWLQAVARALSKAEPTGVVVACSALKRSYRDLLRASAPGLLFVHLTGPQTLLVERLRSRAGHYMPISLLQSQIDTLEPPATDESALTQEISQAPEHIVERLCLRLQNIAA